MEQIVGGATTLASVAGGSREELELLTETSANLAAVTGLSFAQAAENLQRALASGIGAADLFRERGVRRLIESIQGIPDLTKLPLDQQRQAFIDTFGPDALTPFADAAEDLSRTLGGALSNIGDASANARRALGEAFAPSVFATARSVAIPFFQALQALVEDNAQAITDFASRGVQNALRGLADLIGGIARVLEVLQVFRADLSDLGDLATILFEPFRIFFRAVALGFQTLLSGVQARLAELARIGNFLGAVSDETLARLEARSDETFASLAADAAAFGDSTVESLFRINGAIGDLSDEGESFVDELREGENAVRAAADQVARLTIEFQNARREGAAASDEAAALAAARRAQVEQELAQIAREFEEIDREFAEQEIERATTGPDAASERAAQARARAARSVGEDAAEVFASSLTALAQGEFGTFFGESLAEASTRALEDSLGDLFTRLAEQFAGDLEGGLSGALQGLGQSIFGEGVGSGFGSALAGGLGVVGSIVASQIRGTEADTGSQLVRSAVTGTENVRGIVSGPTSIPIQEVGAVLRDTNAEVLRESRRQTGVLEAILTVLRRSSDAPADATAALADALVFELNGSPALG